MKDQLERHLQPTTDMKKAIDKNLKQHKDLSVLLEQLDKEKKMALNHLTVKQDAFKKQIIERQESLPQQFRVQFFQQSAVVGRDMLHSRESLQANRLLRRTLSCGDDPGTVKFELPAVTSERHSLSASPLPRDINGLNGDLTSRFTFKAGSDITPFGRTQYAQSKQDASSNENDRFEELSANTMYSNHFYTKSSGYYAARDPIRRHSDVLEVGNLNNSRLLQRRRTNTVHI